DENRSVGMGSTFFIADMRLGYVGRNKSQRDHKKASQKCEAFFVSNGMRTEVLGYVLTFSRLN
ncbi:hypothetical protein ACR780_12110, partial [Sphingobacterium faecium]|uniref:hypothetical protein n=1 Tax=Sphingobacterium faecium TaxID=34087 RepID=UPI003DA29EA3